MALRAPSRALLCVVAPLVTACGSDATGPADDLSGQWSYTATNLTASGVSCSVAGLTLTLRQNGATFGGSGNGGILTCVSAVDSASTSLDGVAVVNGRVSGQSVSFDFGTADLHHSGSLAGAIISGNATWRIDLGAPDGVIVLAGRFSAARQ